MSIASPLPHPATPLLTGPAVLSSSWPLLAGPQGRLTASRIRGRRSAAGVTVVTPSTFPHFSRSLPRPSAHGSAPHARASRTPPQDHVPVWGHARSRFSGHVENQWSRSLAHPWRSLSHATARPLGHNPISSSRPPWSRLPSHSQSRPMHMMHSGCSDWGAWLMGAFMALRSEPGAGLVWLVGTPRHFTPSVALARALGPPTSLQGGAAVGERIVLPCSLFHTVDSPALLRTGGGADGGGSLDEI
jgi:hypothetical protein